LDVNGGEHTWLDSNFEVIGCRTIASFLELKFKKLV